MVTTKVNLVFLLGWLSGLMMMFTMLQLGWLRGTSSSGSRGAGGQHLPSLSTPQEAGYCPPCDALFSKLDGSPDAGRLVQRVEMQMRGEPKSGTTFMFHWAHGAMVHACDLLNLSFGSKSCRMSDEGQDVTGTPKPETVSLKFQPALGGEDARCPCPGVERVEIIMTDHHKHMLPVRGSCLWHHSNGLVVDKEECMSVANRPVQDHADLWNCVEQAGCEIWDDRPQFVMMRDPRPMAVSSFFYVQTHPETRGGKHPALNMTVDDAVMMMLPGIARYIGLRFNLFQGLLERQSEVFWYDDALADPLRWHYRWLAFAGLNLPRSVVRAASDASVRGEFDFWTEGGPNKHPGGKDPSTKRSWKDEVSPELHAEMDEITRRWLPPAVLAKIGLSLEA
eukprot:g4628.t1